MRRYALGRSGRSRILWRLKACEILCGKVTRWQATGQPWLLGDWETPAMYQPWQPFYPMRRKHIGSFLMGVEDGLAAAVLEGSRPGCPHLTGFPILE